MVKLVQARAESGQLLLLDSKESVGGWRGEIGLIALLKTDGGEDVI